MAYVSPITMAQIPKHSSTCQTCEIDQDVNWKCQSCGKYCCYRCGKTHVSIEKNKDHRVFNINETDELQILKTVRCHIHNDKDISIYCEKCCRFMCTNCLGESKNCEHLLVKLENVYAEDMKNLNKNSDIIEESFNEFFKKEGERFKRTLKLHKENYETEKQKIKTHDQNLKDMITLRTNMLLQDLDDHWKNIQHDMNKLTFLLESKTQLMERKISLINEIKKCNDILYINTMTKDIDDFVLSEVISFIIQPTETKKLQKGKINQELANTLFGSLKSETISLIDFEVLNSYTTDLKSFGSITPIDDKTIWVKSLAHSMLSKIELGDKHPKTVKTIKCSDIFDIALLESGNVLFSIENDPCIKQLTQSGDVITFYKFPRTLLGKPQTPLALHINSDGSICVGTIEAGGRVYNLSEFSHRQVVTLSQKGETLKLYEYDCDGNRLFTYPGRITSNKIGDICVVEITGQDKGRLVTLDSNGKLKWIYTGCSGRKSLFNPRDLVTTTKENIIICDFNNAFHILNYDGQLLECIDTAKFGIVQPVCIDIDHRGRLFSGCQSLANTDDRAKIHILIFTDC